MRHNKKAAGVPAANPADAYDGAVEVCLLESAFYGFTDNKLVMRIQLTGAQRGYISKTSEKSRTKFVILPGRWKAEQTILILGCRKKIKKPIESRGRILVLEITRLCKRLI